MQLSYWEREEFLGSPQAVVVGGGITGLTAALTLKASQPKWDVLVLERGSPPTGASTRNAGFACIGSVTEMSADLETLGEAALVELLSLRWKGLQRLLKNCGAEHIDYNLSGSHELFETEAAFEAASKGIAELNRITTSVCGSPAFRIAESPVVDGGIFQKAVVNDLEGSLNPGKVVNTLLSRASELGVRVLSGAEVSEVDTRKVVVRGVALKPEVVLVCTNGFARQLMPNLEVQPARNQVWLTHPIEGLPFRGIFHMNAGYTYFRTIGKRLLIGGFRHMDAEREATDEFGLTENIGGLMKTFAQERLLPNHALSWDMGWSGILGVGAKRTPILEEVKEAVCVGVRLGGMGVAIGSELGHNLALMALKTNVIDK